MKIHRLLAVLVAMVLNACGYHYRLPGHGTDQTATVTLCEGKTVPALGERIIPLKFGYQLSLASEDPEIVDVRFHSDPLRRASISLVANKPGTTVVHYGNVFNQTFPFGKSESHRLGYQLPYTDPEEPGAATGWARKTWLRKSSDGAFQVVVLPEKEQGESRP